jgi:hypothetical protein
MVNRFNIGGSGVREWKSLSLSSREMRRAFALADAIVSCSPQVTFRHRTVTFWWGISIFADPYSATYRIAEAPIHSRSTLFDLPLLDELRTYCYEHQIEEIPALLAV